MRRTLTVAAIAVLVVAGIAELVAASGRQGPGTVKSVQNTLSTQDMQAKYPGMHLLPVSEIPQP